MPIGAMEGRPRVEMHADRVVIWAGDADDPSGFALWPSAALETAKDMLRLAQPPRDLPSFTGVVEHLSVLAPERPGLSAILRLQVSGNDIDFVLEWKDLIGLAGIANEALMDARSAGQG